MADNTTNRGRMATALGFLGLAGFAFYSMVLQSPAPATSPDDELVDTMVDELDAPTGKVGAGDDERSAGARGFKASVIHADLLARVGSHIPGTVPNSPFRGPLAADASADRRDQQGTIDRSEWQPPRLTVSMVFRAGSVHRASVNSTVVGVGDPLAGGFVQRIERDGLELRLDGTLLFYELQTPYPRGYAPPAVETDLPEQQPGDAVADDPSVLDAGRGLELGRGKEKE